MRLLKAVKFKILTQLVKIAKKEFGKSYVHAVFKSADCKVKRNINLTLKSIEPTQLDAVIKSL
jgi:hypothetical protein